MSWPLDCTGMRVRLKSSVERFPHFIADEGLTGTVVRWEPDELNSMIAVRMDEPLPGSEAWDNEVCWYGWTEQTVLEEFVSDVVVTPTTNPCHV